MARQSIDIGVQGNDGTGDSIRESFRKVNENFVQLFAVFGQGDRIGFTDLDDTPQSYGPDTVIVANADGTALLAKNIVAGSGIEIDNTDETELRIIATGGKVSADPTPELGGHLDGVGTFAVVRAAEPSDDLAAEISLSRSIQVTADDMVISRGYADQRYLQSSGGPGVGSQIRVREEPEDNTEYFRNIDNWSGGYAVITGHGFNSGSNGVRFIYTSTGTPATGLISGQSYYLRFIDANRLGVYATRPDAIDNSNRIIVNQDPVIVDRGVEQFRDYYYDENLSGNWVANEALPRSAIVRRQGDTMEGALILHDHPGTLAGAGSPFGDDDLQAATKYYVDNSSFSSETNLFVSTSGDDFQISTPPGKEGRAWSYAYATVGAACAKAEEIINASLTEPGPYRQVLTYSDNANNAYLNSVGTGVGAARTLNVYTNGGGVDQSKNVANRDLREGSIIKGLLSGATARVITYDGLGLGPGGLDDVYQVELLHYNTDITYFKTDYKAAASKILANKDFIVEETVAFVEAKYPSMVFDSVKCARDTALIIDAIVYDIKFGGNTLTIRAGRSYWTGVNSVLPIAQRAPTADAILYINLLAQAVITNTDIPVSTTSVDFGTRTTEPQIIDTSTEGEDGSGVTIARLIDTVATIVVNGPGDKTTLVEFIENEPLEFGQPVPEAQITIRVESGIYYEQLPIRLPTNVSIKGDEFRRSIIRPAPGQSQSPWANLYFYRDDEFDGLTRTYMTSPLVASTKQQTSLSSTGTGTVATINFLPQASVPFPSGSRVFVVGSSVPELDGHHEVITGTVSSITFASSVTANVGGSATIKGTIVNISGGTLTGLETEMYLTVMAGTGQFEPGTQVTRLIDSSNFELNLAPKTKLTNATVRGLNGSGLAPTGRNFGYHYLVDPTGESGVFDASVPKTGGYTSEGGILTTQKNYIRSQVISYINTTFPDLEYDETLCSRDVGLIVDAVVYDIVNGGVSRSLAAGHSYKRNVSARIAVTTQLTETLAGITHINTLAQTFLTASPAAAALVADLISGIKNIIIGTNNPPKANKDMDVFLLNDGTILRNITCQGHGGFMCVLDPEGQIQTKSPYFQTATCLSGSVNKKSFRGGMFIDGFSGSLPATVESRVDSTTIVLGGLTVRAPGIPTSFVITGVRYQINAVSNYDRVAGTCTVKLDASTPFPVNDPDTAAPWVYPYNIIIGTPGNKSMLANDFTQVNDLGYGVIATNNGLSELVSIFTYYNWTSYYALNGAQIRSLNGSSCNGVYGLRAAGRDPNEVPDPVVLEDNTLQMAKIFKRSSFAAKNVKGETAIFIDYYDFIPYNVTEVEIDHTPTLQSAIENTSDAPNNIVLVNPGTGYSVDDILTVTGGTPTGSQLTQFRVTAITGPGPTGPIGSFELINPGSYTIPPTGGTFGNPVTNGIVPVSGGGGASATFSVNYLGPINTYEVSTLETTTVVGAGVDPGGAPGTRTVIRCNLNTGGRADVSTSLTSDLVDGQIVTLRSLQNLRFSDVQNILPVRPSTALEFTAPYENAVYRTLAYNLTFSTGGALPANQAVLSFDQSFSYTILQTNPLQMVDSDYVDGGPKTMGSLPGDTKIAIKSIANPATITRINSGVLLLPVGGRLHVVEEYVPENVGLGQSAYVTISEESYGEGSIVPVTVGGLEDGITTTRVTNLRAGLPSGEPAEITVNISTCRATGHDFLDVGSGGFNSTNYPSNIYGSPASTPIQANEVIEETQGRVFYVSTDQDGIFRVGPFFTVDQGTGTVTFSASIALSNLDGIGFKKGVVVKEFSTDDTFTDNADDAVPVESAVQGYIDRRLGYTRTGVSVASSERLPVGGGFLPLIGSPTLEADLSMGSTIGHRITNLVYNASSPTDAATIGYVDQQVALYDTLAELQEVNVMSPSNGDLAVFTPSGSLLNATVSGDISLTLTSSKIATLVGGITTPPTIDNGITGTTQLAVSGGVVVNEDISTWPATGHFRIGEEIFKYTSKTDGAKRFDNVTRAKFLTTASTHTAGSQVISLENSELNLQIVSGTIVNSDVSSTANIAQSKLNLLDADVSGQKGIATFSNSNFSATSGTISVKAGGIALSNIQNISAGSILGNLTGTAAAPQEVTTSNLVSNGVNNAFTSSMNNANALVRQFNRLKTTTTFTSIAGTEDSGTSGTYNNIPVTSLTGSGHGAVVDVDFDAGVYTGVTVIHGGSGYAEGDQLFIDGALLEGQSGLHDLTFTVETTGSNIDTNSYLGITRVSQTAEPNSIVKTDNVRNIGNSFNRYNTVYAETLDGSANIIGGAIANLDGLGFAAGVVVNEFTTDDTFAAATDSQVPTASAVKNFVTNNSVTNTGVATFSITNPITTAGSDQSTATGLTKTINVIATSVLGQGVRLPTAEAGNIIIVRNSGDDDAFIYPGTGASIAGGASNDPITLFANASILLFAASTTEWFIVNATFA